MSTICKIQCPECSLWIYGFWGTPGEIRADSDCPRILGLVNKPRCRHVWDAILIAAFDKSHQT